MWCAVVHARVVDDRNPHWLSRAPRVPFNAWDTPWSTSAIARAVVDYQFLSSQAARVMPSRRQSVSTLPALGFHAIESRSGYGIS